MAKVDREMEAAMVKHGKVSVPKGSHISDFYDRIERNKKDIVSSA